MAKKKVKSKASKSSHAVKSSAVNPNHDDVIAAALSTVNTPVLLKVCRLCETKDGPFLNIFDSDRSTARKIDYLMPFGIAEYDDLPHKICFRCSAKVEELHEFVQKCIKTQQSLHEALGKKAPLLTKNNLRTQWEEKLNKSNISNDDICNALIKKALEGIKDIPLDPNLEEDDDKPLRPKISKIGAEAVTVKKELQNTMKTDNDTDVTLKNLRLSIEKCDNHLNPGGLSAANNSTVSVKTSEDVCRNSKTDAQQENKQNAPNKNKHTDSEEEEKLKKRQKSDPPFNIMDHVTTIKVNSVGILFQCKLCNRNFLKKEVVENHGCAKNGIPKIDLTANFPPPEPPKPPNTVKYIKLDNTKRPSAIKDKAEVENKKVPPEATAEKPKIKTKIGPASKVKKYTENESQKESSEKNTSTSESSVAHTSPVVSFPTNPNTNVLYKLVPGPNNTFTLVSGNSTVNQEATEETSQKGKKRKASDENQDSRKPLSHTKSKPETPNGEVIDLETETETVPPPVGQPYPVGLFQTRPHHSTTYPLAGTSETPAFTTPAMKKQSYTVVQTGNPSKLVISTKSKASTEEVPRKRPKKTKPEENPKVVKEPYSVTIEDVTPPKDPGFFTFINVDPLLQPSYVLPTNNIIQESQISTSTPAVKNKTEAKDKYSCNMCGEGFSREKKLLTHIQSHYNKMDEEDKLREKNLSKRRGKKS
ncbi:uncharacterized protein LOC115440921 [Manduca sexta]|uniref:uncharacterized protein LOC115440921 n=1 Tax=Manduca sexta TaxID=7130 RepID=UPI00188F8622|nr:uncharacterized protein LOC115440921 [Manduca sexta]